MSAGDAQTEEELRLAVSLHLAGRIDDAKKHYRHVLERRPDTMLALANLGAILMDEGSDAEALACCDAAIACAPGRGDIHYNRGVLLTREGRTDEALAAFDRALACDPGNASAHASRGTLLMGQERQDEALDAFNAALALDPTLYDAWNNVGFLLDRLGRKKDAILACGKAVALKPDFALAIFNMGKMFFDLLRDHEALTCYRRALALDDSVAEGHAGLGQVLGFRLDYAGAIAAFEKAENLEPGKHSAMLLHYRQKACDWRDLALLEEKAVTAFRAGRHHIPSFAALTFSDGSAIQKEIGERISARMEREARPALPPYPPRDAHDRLRIGYLSGDLHTHPVTLLIAEMLERHDRARFEIALYSYGPPRTSGVRERVKAAAEHFIDIYDLPFDGAARRIRNDGIDILVDLTGHTLFSRSVIAAFRPAPVQVSYLGFPGTMGAGFIDYIIADPYLVPMDQQPFFTENIVHLPDGYQPGDSKRRARSARRGDQGLPENALVFAAFNNPNKITPAIFDIWMRLLREAPGSVLWLLSDAPVTENNLRREAQARGVAGERLIFANRVDIPDYLGRLALADLFLDCHPYNAGATANDALWMGLPVLTCSGGTYVSRMAGSLLTTLGLPELITHSLPDYETRAIELIHDPARLAAIRARLAERRETSPLFDTVRYTRNLEAAYTRMWDIHAAGEAPRPFTVRPASNRQILPLS